MKKILIFSLTYYPTRVGGAEVAIKEITDRIPSEEIEFHMVTLRVDMRLPKTERFGAVVLHRVGMAADVRELSGRVPFSIKLAKALYPVDAFFAALSLHRKYHFDGIWAMMAAYAGFAALFFKLVHPRVPYLLTLQEGDPIPYILNKVKRVRFLFDRIFQKADRIQTISTYLADWARTMGYTGDIAVIPNGVDTSRFAKEFSQEERSALRSTLGSEGETLLITTSRLVEKNGIDDVIRALPQVPNVRFLVYGTGPDDAKLAALAEKEGVNDRVSFKGQASHAELPLILASCDIFTRPSRSEGMGNSFIEAMAAGLPVIATQEGGIADFLFDAKRDPELPSTGFAVDKDSPAQIADAIERVMAHPAETAKVIGNAKKLALEKYDWSLIAKNMREEFRLLVGVE